MTFNADFAAAHDGHIRLAVLRLLNDAPGYCANDSVLHQAAEALGLTCSRDQMRGHLAWLVEQRLVTTMQTGANLIVATLSERGADVAAGRSIVSGVQRPSPKG